MESSNASPSAFGWDFQSNAAIVLMLTNINVASSVKVEGIEDIEVVLNTGDRIFSQSKSVSNPYDDFSNVLTNLKDGLRTLNNSSKLSGVKNLIYITNTPNPFSNQKTMGAFNNSFNMLTYEELPEACKNKIDDICAKEQYSFNKELFSVCVVQFYGNPKSRNRYGAIKDRVNEFLQSVDLGDIGLGEEILKIWQRDFFVDATSPTSKISKEDMIWPLIVTICKIDRGDAVVADCDDGDFDEIKKRYSQVIFNSSERFEFVSKVLSAYTEYQPSLNYKEKTESFISNCWVDYMQEFDLPNTHEDTIEKVVKLAISNVIKRRHKILQIKKGVGLS